MIKTLSTRGVDPCCLQKVRWHGAFVCITESMASLQSGNSNFVHIGLSSLSIGYVNACFQEQQQKHNKKKTINHVSF